MSDGLDELQRLNQVYHGSSKVSQALVLARTVEEALPQICRRLADEGGFVLAWIGCREAAGGKVAPMAWTGACGLEQIKMLAEDGGTGEGLVGGVLNGGKTVVCNDYAGQSASAPCRALAKEAGLRAAAALPLQIGGGAPGVLALYAPKTDFFRGKVILAAEEMAQGVSAGLDELHRKNARKAALAHEAGLLRSLMENPMNLIYFKDLDSRFIRASHGLAERLGTTPQELVGKSDADFFREEHAREALEDEQRIIRTGEPMTGKVEKETWKTGEDTWCLSAKFPLRNEAGEIIGTFGISKDFTAVKQAEAKLEQMQSRLLVASRMAGMAEVATSILHNVGNVLNSVNVSNSVVVEKVRNSRLMNVAKLAGLLQENSADLAGFFTSPKGRQVPSYLSDLAAHLAAEREEILRELHSLTTNIEHIKEIVAAQQSYAGASGVVETIHLSDLVEDAMGMHRAAMGRHAVTVVREFGEVPPLVVDKHKVLQILINLLHNSKYALDDCNLKEKRLTVRIEKSGADRVRVSVIDNGVGIAAENLARVFEHGFTTRKGGHGFGLHSGALTAKELGGSLTAQSEGLNHGATFILELPCESKKAAL